MVPISARYPPMDSKLTSVTYDPFMSMGSGSVAAYGELESGYSDDLTLDQARDLAIRAIKAGITYDLGSGSNVDIVVLTKGKTDFFRNIEIVGKKEIIKSTPYVFERNNIRELNSCAEDSRKSF